MTFVNDSIEWLDPVTDSFFKTISLMTFKLIFLLVYPPCHSLPLARAPILSKEIQNKIMLLYHIIVNSILYEYSLLVKLS